jgi:hypothetical protein
MKELLLQHLETRGDGEYIAFNRWVDSLATGNPTDSRMYKGVCRQEYDRRLSEIKDAILRYPQSGIFVACFSAEGDSLSQWRAYGKMPSYAIGFNAEKIRNIATQNQLDSHAGDPSALPIFDVVTYVSDVKDPMLREIIDAALWNYMEVGHTAMYAVFSGVSPFIKDASFSDERESRLCCRQPVFEGPVRFRAGGSHLIPYIEIPIPLTSIKEIMVGPGPNVELDLMSIDMVRRVQELDCEISASKLPFRNW